MRPNKSTQMVLDRKATIRHLCGQSIRFEPGVPIGVPPQMVKSAVSIGAKVYNGDTPDFSEEEANNRLNAGPVDPDERQEDILKVVKEMIARNERSEWTGTGVPKITRVTELVGYKVQKEEIVAAFAAARNNPEETVETGE